MLSYGLPVFGQCVIVAAILTCLAVLVLNKSQRQILFTWVLLPPRGRRIETSKTPPRSLSPEKKVPNNGPPTVPYKDTYPPSRRGALANVAKQLSLAQREKLAGRDVDQIEFKKCIIPFTADYRECGSTYTPMELSIDEIKALGDFPDYAELCGVPLPEAYKEFNIETALPRPYRPFRWAYHQTMGKHHLSSSIYQLR